jgi:hypothetical protein
MLKYTKIQAIFYSLLLFIGIASAPAVPTASAEGRIKIPQKVITDLKESAQKDREEAERQLKLRDQAIQNLWKIIEEAEKQRVQTQKESP